MSTPEPTGADPLLRALCEHLERQERSLDVEALGDRILKQSHLGSPRPGTGQPPIAASRRKRTWPAWTLGLASAAVAAGLLIALLLLPSPQLRAEQALRAAEAALHLPVERCYLVEVQREGTATPDEPLPARTMRVWTAGDRFRVEVTRGSYRWSWGRDVDGSVWLVASLQRGLRIAPEEQGPALLWACDLYGLQPETVLLEILAHCQIEETRQPEAGSRRVIRARPRPGSRPAWLRSAVLELDAETSAIRELRLTRLTANGNEATTLFTLVDTRPVDAARYRLEGHLGEPYQIFDRDFEPERRREILSRWVGPYVDRWLIPEATR